MEPTEPNRAKPGPKPGRNPGFARAKPGFCPGFGPGFARAGPVGSMGFLARACPGMLGQSSGKARAELGLCLGFARAKPGPKPRQSPGFARAKPGPCPGKTRAKPVGLKTLGGCTLKGAKTYVTGTFQIDRIRYEKRTPGTEGHKIRRHTQFFQKRAGSMCAFFCFFHGL